MARDIPTFVCNLGSLQCVFLSNNCLEGPIPQCLGNINRSLQLLHLKGNYLHDIIPSIFTNDCALKSLNLNMNQFVLDVGNNKIRFNGTLLLPLKTNALFPKFQVFDIAKNSFTGSFSDRYLKSLTTMIDVEQNITMDDEVHIDEFYMELIIKGSDRQVERLRKTFTTIDKSDNIFCGSIQKFIGTLTSLRYLNLSHNNLTRDIYHVY
ncbi:hypothetical protein ACS0TY_028467 [Phlomoides rotata]